jgi:hypothetical protein
LLTIKIEGLAVMVKTRRDIDGSLGSRLVAVKNALGSEL